MMTLYHLTRSQFLPVSIEEAWPYFWSPQNLEAMTPSFLRFKITSEVPQKIYSGLIITYKIKAVAGVPMTWVTEIKHVVDQHRFVDEQRLGPFKFWLHEHRFHAVEGGIVMEDIVHYAMPFGLLGPLVHRLFVRKRLETIFDFRARFLKERWPQP